MAALTLVRRAILPWLCWLAPLAVLAAEPPDVRLLIDVSGSMRQTDPNNLRVPALRLVNELLPAGATAGVWLFAEKSEPLIPPSRVDDAWKDKSRARLDRIHSRGLYTDIEKAIQAATEGWEQPAPEGSERHLVLFTDGLVDVAKDPEKNAESRARVLSEQLERLKTMGAKVHAIGLSERVDTELMRLLATQTGGWRENASDAEALQRIFLRVLEQTAAPTTVPIQGNSFEIDDRVSEFTLLAFRETGSQTQLTAPDGTRIRADQLAPGVTWRAELGYDLVTLSTPKPGKWRLRGVQDPDNRVVVVTDLDIAASPIPNSLGAGQTVAIETWLTEHGQPLTRADLLKLVAAKAILVPEAETAPPQPPPPPAPAPSSPSHEEGQGPAPETPAPPSVEPAPGTPRPDERLLEFAPESGRFVTRLETQSLVPGVYRLELVIDGGTFKRQLSRRFKLTGSPLSIEPRQHQPTETDPSHSLTLTLKVEPDLIDPASLFGYLLIEPPEGPREVLEITAGKRFPLGIKIPVQLPGDHRVTSAFMARTLTGDAIAIRPDPLISSFDFTPLTTRQADEPGDNAMNVSWLGLSGYLAAGNALLGTLLGLTWWLMERRRTSQQAKPGQPSKRKRT